MITKGEVINRLHLVCDHVVDNPRRLDMAVWNYSRNAYTVIPLFRKRRSLQPECKTVACLSGWSQILFPIASNEQGVKPAEEEIKAGMHSLGFHDESIAEQLFYVDNWQPQYSAPYKKLEEFIKKWEDDLNSDIILDALQELAYLTKRQVNYVIEKHIRGNENLELYEEPIVSQETDQTPSIEEQVSELSERTSGPDQQTSEGSVEPTLG
jgi:hypothetical protein